MGEREASATLGFDDSSSRVLAPHRPLPRYYASAAARPAFLRRLFDETARHYDRIDSLMTLGSGRRYRRQVLARAGLTAGHRVLDVATGTGLVALEAKSILSGRGRVLGLDPSPGMLAEARRADAADAYVLARAEALPFPDASFDFVSLGYALRHMSDLRAGFGEFGRVLKPGGRLLVLELSRPRHSWSRALAELYLGRTVPYIARLVTGNRKVQRLMRYHWATIAACVPAETIMAAMTAAGFEAVRCDVQLGVCNAYMAAWRA